MNLVKNYNKVLIIDDDERILTLLTKILNNSGFIATGVLNTDEARKKIEEAGVLVVDWMMPHETGIDFIHHLRQQGNDVPVILLTALDHVDNKVLAFKYGVDDYITKPFDERELIARLRRIFEKNQKYVIHFGECAFNPETGKLLRGNEEIFLSSTELSLLTELLKRPNRPVSRKVLAAKLGTIVSDRTVDVQITRLRKRIGDTSKPYVIIQSTRHVGYTLILKD